MKIRIILLGALLAALGGVCVAPSEPAGRLNLADPIDDDAIDLSRVSYVIVSTETGEIVEARWERLEEPMPVGSLVKTVHRAGLRRESLFSVSCPPMPRSRG